MTTTKKRTFPCPYCRGNPTWHEFCLDDGSCADGSCGACDGEGFVEVGGRIHQRMKVNNMIFDLFAFTPTPTTHENNWHLTSAVWDRVEELITSAVTLAANPESWTEEEE